MVREGRISTGQDVGCHDNESILISWLQNGQKVGPCRHGNRCCSGARVKQTQAIKPKKEQTV